MKSQELSGVKLPDLSASLKELIDKACNELYQDTPAWRLGASKIGDDCKRAVWYNFRWCSIETLDARTLRLLNRGDREESRFIEWLQKAGCEVWAFEEQILYYHPESESYFCSWSAEEGDGLIENVSDFEFHVKKAASNGVTAQKRQYSISGCNGHFGGKIDAVVKLPESCGFGAPMLASFKTNGTGKGFTSLFKDGFTLHKPMHWAQECTYGFKLNLEYVAYFNINKNDDDLYVEVAKLDLALGKQMEEKAQIVIKSQTPPARISDNPNCPKCKMCKHAGVCHNDEKIHVNCRSCSNAAPVDNGQWFCSVHNANIPREFIESFLTGASCQYWKDITK